MNDDGLWRAHPCKEWTGAKSKAGYGQKRASGRTCYVHRLAWEEAHGPIPPGIEVCHHCDNPACYEIAHLFLGTHAQNLQDMRSKGRARGRNSATTHCPAGHPYDEANTYRNPNTGVRHCRACRAVHSRKAVAERSERRRRRRAAKTE